MSKRVRFAPSLESAPLSPHDDAAMTMLDLQRSNFRGSTSSNQTKRKYCETLPTTCLPVGLISPDDGDECSVMKRFVRDPSLLAPPFLHDCQEFDSMERDAKRAKSINPLDLLSTVSLQLEEESAEKYLARAMAKTTTLESTSESHLQKGCKTYPNGSTYLGHFLNNTRHGFGICIYHNGHVYTGLWNDGKRHGLGKMEYANGQSYEGQWVNDQQEGRGVFFHSDGAADVAFWSGGKIVFGVRWDCERQFMWRLVDGVQGDMIGRKVALEIGKRVGVEGVPETMM